jgi:hypothetical protein
MPASKTPPRGIVSRTLVTHLIELGSGGGETFPPPLKTQEQKIRDRFGRAAMLRQETWRNAAACLSRTDLVDLIKGVVYCCRLMNWAPSASTPLVPLYWEFARQFPDQEPELTNWIADNRINPDEPFNGYRTARSLAEYQALVRAAR